MLFGNIYGLDLGTYEIKVYDKKYDRIWKEKNTIAIKEEKEIFAIGNSAYEMYEKSPYNIEVVFPMQEGVISRFYDMQYLLQNLVKQGKGFARGSNYVIAVPTDVTEVEKKAFYDLVVHSSAKAKDVRIVERGIADAIGLGLDVESSTGIFIVNMGSETIELSVLAAGGMVFSRILKSGGVSLDQAIINHIRNNNDFLIGKLTAESLRRNLGGFSNEIPKEQVVSGRNLLNGAPEQCTISSNQVRAAIKEELTSCAREIKTLLDRTPPQVLKSIQEQGIYLTGGLSNLIGVASYIEGVLGVKVNVASEPEFCAVRGLKKIIQSKELRKLTYSMLDENYRWMK